MSFVSTNDTVKIKIGNFDITNSKSEKLLGVKFDHKLSFDDHISELCKKASRKINALSRVASYMNISKRRTVSSWLRSLNHNLAIAPLYGCIIAVLTVAKWIDYTNGACEHRLKRCWKKLAVSVHNQYIQTLATEMYKIKNDLPLLIVTKLFRQRNEQHQDLRKNT